MSERRNISSRTRWETEVGYSRAVRCGPHVWVAGASLEDVVRTRMYVTDISAQGAVGRAHAEVLGRVKPCATLIGIPALVEPALVVEIKVEAYVEGEVRVRTT